MGVWVLELIVDTKIGKIPRYQTVQIYPTRKAARSSKKIYRQAWKSSELQDVTIKIHRGTDDGLTLKFDRTVTYY